jgi:hypothetical protein
VPCFSFSRVAYKFGRMLLRFVTAFMNKKFLLQISTTFPCVHIIMCPILQPCYQVSERQNNLIDKFNSYIIQLSNNIPCLSVLKYVVLNKTHYNVNDLTHPNVSGMRKIESELINKIMSIEICNQLDRTNLGV